MWCLCAMPVRNNKNTPCLSSLCTLFLHGSKDKHPGNPSVLVPHKTTFYKTIPTYAFICILYRLLPVTTTVRVEGIAIGWDNKMLSISNTFEKAIWLKIAKAPNQISPSHTYTNEIRRLPTYTTSPYPHQQSMQHVPSCASNIVKIKDVPNLLQWSVLPLYKHGCLRFFSWSLQFSTSTGALPLPNW